MNFINYEYYLKLNETGKIAYRSEHLVKCI